MFFCLIRLFYRPSPFNPAASFLISGILAFNVNITKRINRSIQVKSSMFEKLGYVYRFLKNNRGLFAVYIYFGVFNFLLYPVGNIYFPYVFNVLLKAEPIQLALVQASVFIGVIIGSIIIPRLLSKSKFRKTFITNSLIVVVIELFASVTIAPVLLKRLSAWIIAIIFMVLSIILGMVMTSINIHIAVIFQKRVSDDVRGRVSALVSAFVSGVMPVSYMVSGFIANDIPKYLITFCAALSIFVSAAILARIKEVNEL